MEIQSRTKQRTHPSLRLWGEQAVCWALKDVYSEYLQDKKKVVKTGVNRSKRVKKQVSQYPSWTTGYLWWLH